jgi:hypothetical protein
MNTHSLPAGSVKHHHVERIEADIWEENEFINEEQLQALIKLLNLRWFVFLCLG